MYSRIISFVGIIFAALFLPFWAFVPIALLYALVWTPYELLVLAVCIDSQFGDVDMGVWYKYTLAVSLIFLLTTSIKPYLRLYT